MLIADGDIELGLSCVDAGAQGFLFSDELSPLRLQRALRSGLVRRRYQAATDLELGRERVRRLELLARAALALTSTPNIQELLNRAADFGRRLLDAHQCVVLFVEEQNWAGMQLGVSLSDKYADFRDFATLPRGHGLYRVVCRGNITLRLDDAQLRLHPAWRGLEGVGDSHPPLRGLLAVSLVGREGTHFGALLASDKHQGDFSPEDEGLLKQFAQLTTADLELRQVWEREAEIYAKLTRTNEQLERFVSAVSHDLRAPLRGVRQLASWIAEDLEAARNEEVLANLRLLTGRIERMQLMLEGLLNYARIGRTALTVAEIEPRSFLRETIELLEPPASFEISVSAPIPSFSTAVAPLRQVIQNLVDNAIKHHDRGGGQVAVSISDRGDAFELRVSDDGPGIPQKQHEAVFVPFRTLQAAHKEGGSGMGLTLVKRVVEQLGGAIAIVSKGARGTCFVIRWPKLRAGHVYETPSGRTLETRATNRGSGSRPHPG